MAETRALLARNLRQVREAAGYTQVSLAVALEVTQQAVSSWEAGETFPTPENLDKLSEILSVRVCALLCPDEAA
jgi:transcriptional regulator with XRE-family HTH domain